MTCSSCGTLNPEGMRYCGMCGRALQHVPAVHERRQVSVVFLDLAAFSELTREFDPEDLRDLADEVLTVVAGIVEDYDGYVDAFKGDGLIALFGAPHSHPDDPKRAVLAAAASLKVIQRIGNEKGYPLKGRAGVNSGMVIAGSIGGGRVKDYTAMGRTVNLAARFEAAATVGEVWVGESTYKATEQTLSYDVVNSLDLQGFPDVTEAYRLLSINEKRELDPYADVSFVGRNKEHESLNQIFQTVIDQRQAHEVWLVGDAGIGKTRLLNEFLKHLPCAGVLWLDEYPGDLRGPWRRLATQVFELPSNEDKRSREQRILQGLETFLPNQDRWQTLILSSLSLNEVVPWTRLERRSLDRTVLAWRDLLIALEQAASERGLVFVVENNVRHAQLVAFLSELKKVSAPILIVRTSRGSNVPKDVQTLNISPLSAEESLTLLHQVTSPLLKIASESLIVQAGGIPAYVLELGRALSLTQTQSFTGTLTSLLQARLDMLSREDRRLLAEAALTGERCWHQLLQVLGGDDYQKSLERFARDTLLVPEAHSSLPEQVEYRFQSELLRRAVARMIPFSERPLIHLKIATWLEEHAPLELSFLTAYHFQQGNAADAAYPHYLTAADRALSDDQCDEAFDYYETLLSLELQPHLLAQAALAYTQAALSYARHPVAIQQLSAADQWIEESHPDERQALRRVHEDLCKEVNLDRGGAI